MIYSRSRRSIRDEIDCLFFAHAVCIEVFACTRCASGAEVVPLEEGLLALLPDCVVAIFDMQI